VDEGPIDPNTANLILEVGFFLKCYPTHLIDLEYPSLKDDTLLLPLIKWKSSNCRWTTKSYYVADLDNIVKFDDLLYVFSPMFSFLHSSRFIFHPCLILQLFFCLIMY
jgi:hypothetical protein